MLAEGLEQNKIHVLEYTYIRTKWGGYQLSWTSLRMLRSSYWTIVIWVTAAASLAQYSVIECLMNQQMQQGFDLVLQACFSSM